MELSQRRAHQAARDARVQAERISRELVDQGVSASAELPEREITALIAYLQRLGTDISNPEVTEVPTGGTGSSNK